jgi:hypothetical protein
MVRPLCHFDDDDVNGGGNTGLYQRSLYFAGLITVDMEGPLYRDLFQVDCLILLSTNNPI